MRSVRLSVRDAQGPRPVTINTPVVGELSRELDAWLARLKVAERDQIAAFNRLLQNGELPVVEAKPLTPRW